MDTLCHFCPLYCPSYLEFCLQLEHNLQDFLRSSSLVKRCLTFSCSKKGSLSFLTGLGFFSSVRVKLLSCPTLCNPTDCSLSGSSVHGIFQAGVGCHFLLQEIFSAQGLNPGLLHCRQVLYLLSHQGSPILVTVLTVLLFPVLQSGNLMLI